MSIEYRKIRPDEVKEFLKIELKAFGLHPGEAGYDDKTTEQTVEPERSHVACDGKNIVGTASVLSFDMSVPGGELPVAGVSLVGVLPTHTRRGILRQLMREQLDDVIARGEAMAALWSSEASIYSRFGYGSAAPRSTWTIDTANVQFKDSGISASGSTTMRMIEKDEALKLFPVVYEKCFTQQPGFMRRKSEVWWQDRLDSKEGMEHAGVGKPFFVVCETDGDPTGYLAYRVKLSFDKGGIPGGRLHVVEAMAATTAALRATWQYCLGLDLMPTVEAWFRPLEEPLVHLLANPRQLRRIVSDSLWLRILDVPKALEARSYLADSHITFRLIDKFNPATEGVYTLEASAEGATCTRSKKKPDLTMPVGVLGSLYLGGKRIGPMSAAGLVEAHTPDALERAHALFTWHTAPWCPSIF